MIAPESNGRVEPTKFREALRPNTLLIALLHASNVTGIVQPGDADPAIYLPLTNYLIRHDSADAIPKLLPRIVERLNSKDYRDSSPALSLLINLGPKAAPAIPDLVKIMRGSNVQAQSQAASILGRIGEPAIPALKELLVDADDSLRQRVVQALGQMQKPGLPLLIELLKGPHGTPTLRAQGMNSLLGELDSSPEVRALFVESMTSMDRSLRHSALQGLVNRPSLPASFGPLLVERLVATKETSEAEREVELPLLLNALAHVEEVDAKSTLPHVIELAKSPNMPKSQFAFLTPIAAANAWATLDTAAPEPLTILANGVADSTDSVAVQSSQAIARHALRCRAVLPQIKKGLSHPNAIVRVAAARILALHNSDTAEVTAAMLHEMNETNFGQSYAAMGVIALIPSSAKSAIPKLIELSAGNQRYYAFTAIVPLAADNPEAEAFLVDQFKNHPQAVQYLLNPLMSATRLSPAVLAALSDLLNHENYRALVSQILAAFDPKSHEAVAPLVMQSILGGESQTFSPCLPEALRAISQKNTELQTQLRELLKTHASPQVRAAIARAVWHIDHNAESVLPALLADLQEPRQPAWQYWTLRTLADMGPAAKPAFPRILKLATSLNLESQRAAVDALQKIDPEAAKAAGF